MMYPSEKQSGTEVDVADLVIDRSWPQEVRGKSEINWINLLYKLARKTLGAQTTVAWKYNNESFFPLNWIYGIEKRGGELQKTGTAGRSKEALLGSIPDSSIDLQKLKEPILLERIRNS
ncbi:hypothetical protein JTB14_023225 [Gonioctena quinquepunctata]|nr:hypothetical protein JTB14_023225 [Gonioctena quinquepunctata]